VSKEVGRGQEVKRKVASGPGAAALPVHRDMWSENRAVLTVGALGNGGREELLI
jgi:hypothetical protein